jgi:hypothetical protein
MEKIYIRLNVRRWVFIGVIMGFMFFISLYLLFVRGLNVENGIGMVMFGSFAAYAIYRVSHRRPVLVINAYGYTKPGRMGRTLYWENINDLKFEIVGRRSQVLAVKTERTRDIIPLDDVAIDPEELYDIFYNLSILPQEEREGFVRYVKGERTKRGQF